MSSISNNTLHTPADVVTLNKLRPPAVKNESPAGTKIPASSGTPITLPEDVVTLSSKIPGEGATAVKKKPSVAVSQDEKQALLAAELTDKGFSVYA